MGMWVQVWKGSRCKSPDHTVAGEQVAVGSLGDCLNGDCAQGVPKISGAVRGIEVLSPGTGPKMGL